MNALEFAVGNEVKILFRPFAEGLLATLPWNNSTRTPYYSMILGIINLIYMNYLITNS
jgi:hypothetical protein